MNKNLNVLVVEDSEDDSQLMLRELCSGGYVPTLKRVETAQEMRAALKTSKWHLILADYNLPQFNAPQALEVLKKTDLDLPFIVISGTIGEDTAVQLMKAGAHDYVNKQSLRRLVPAVQRELREAQIRSERRQAQEDLMEVMRLYRSLAENLPGLLYRLFPTGKSRTRFFNNMLEPITGYSAAELAEGEISPLDALILPEDRSPVIRVMQEAIENSRPFQIEYRLQHKNGEIRYLHERGRAFRSVEGERAFVDGIIFDITPSVRLKEALNNADENPAVTIDHGNCLCL